MGIFNDIRLLKHYYLGGEHFVGRSQESLRIEGYVVRKRRGNCQTEGLNLQISILISNCFCR